ncbi:MFS transporter [Agaricicola taiwanensis]|uniref:MFS transporter n=2 Tax=Agaricicola taiwanensis TaxID=591372 RepID=A0A8J2YB43_9RHOB|nr:MFS transporter [Agaricicola taiwanensis]
MVLSGFLTLALAMGIGRFFYTPVLPLMQTATGFGPDAAGFLGSVNLTGYLVGSILMSLIGGEPLRRRIFRIGLIVSVATTLAMGLTENFTAWIVIRTLSGVASAVCMILATGYVFEAVAMTGEQRTAGWLWGGVSLGMVISGLLVRFMSDVASWDQLWLLAGAFAALVVPLIWREVGPWRHSPSAGRGDILRQPRPFPFMPLFWAYACEGLGYSVFATFIVAILKARPGLEIIADYAWVIAGLVGIPAGLAWMWLGQRIGIALALALAYVAQLIGVLLPALSEGAVAAIVAAGLFGGTFGAISLLALPLGKAGGGGRGIAILTAGFSVGQIIGPAAAGHAVALGRSFEESLIGSGAVLGLGVLLLVYGMWRRRYMPAA